MSYWRPGRQKKSLAKKAAQRALHHRRLAAEQQADGGGPSLRELREQNQARIRRERGGA